MAAKFKAEAPAVYLIDNDPGFAEAVRFVLGQAGMQLRVFANAEVFLEFLPDTLEEYLAVAPSGRRCALVDIKLPGIDGLCLQEQVHRRGIFLPIIFITGYDDVPTSVQAIKAGAENFLLKPVAMNVLLAAVYDALAKGEKWMTRETRRHAARLRLGHLTPREAEVLSLAVQGLSNKLIARRLAISARTVEHHKSSIIGKTGAATLLDLARMVEESDFDAG